MPPSKAEASTVAAPAPERTAAVDFASGLERFGENVALIGEEETVTYRELAARADRFAARLGGVRRLVMLCGANTIDTLVAYLGALRGGHVVLLTGGDEAAETLIAGYDPDVVVRGATVQERRCDTAHHLHPELALLLSTSGSTGSAKLVRLSHGNLDANAASIAQYLAIAEDDRAATTLPMHYCYGLSVIHSYLLRGASLLLTEESVAEADFWQRFRANRCTSFAGVPYTFELLDRCGFAAMALPSLRYVTQAGGRLAPDSVRRYAELGQRAGWDFVVMYGQTEATARMAYLPPRLAVEHPASIGIAVPGGTLRLEPVPGEKGQELVYSGPNVMLGYAESAADLRLGRTVEELRTGDLARLNADGLFEIVGRRSRFAKVYGLRVDLQRVEEKLRGDGITAWCVEHGNRLAVLAEAEPRQAQRAQVIAAQFCRLPPHAVVVRAVRALPRLANGKPDYAAARDLFSAAQPAPARPGATVEGLIALYAQLLGREGVTAQSTFTGLGGDSLSYVELSIRLEQALGHLPGDWHHLPIAELVRAAAMQPRQNCTLDTSVALRAVSIVLIVGTHAALFGLPGGAHVLLAVAGFNFARFHLTATERAARIRGMARSVGRLASASVLWIAIAAVFFSDAYGPAQVLLLHNVIGNQAVFNDFWFVETVGYILLGVLALTSLPAVDRLERRHRFLLPMALTTVALISRYQLIPGVRLATPLVVVWLFMLGWAAAQAAGHRQRLLVTAVALLTIPGFHGDLGREILMVAGFLLLVWVPRLPSRQWLNRLAGPLAAASLYIYLTHWQVFPKLADQSAILALVASLAVGIAYHLLAVKGWQRLVSRWRRKRLPATG